MSRQRRLICDDKYIQDVHDEANSEECVELFNQPKQTETDQAREIRKHLTKTMTNN